MRKMNDYEEVLNRARWKRKGIAPIAGVCVLAAVVVIGGGLMLKKKGPAGPDGVAVITAAAEEADGQETAAEKIPEDPAVVWARSVDEVIASYQKLGIIKVEGYLNIHKTAAKNGEIIGKLYKDSAVEVLDVTEDGWMHISSGGIDGYVAQEYVLTGDEAAQVAREAVKERAIINTEVLRVRVEPTVNAETYENVLINERYEVVDSVEGWIRIRSGWISADYAEVKPCLNEARKLDLRQQVLNMYENLGVSVVSNYLNIRDSASEDGKIIGKMVGKAGCDVLAAEGDWLKVRSGDITGYVKAEYIATGETAKQEALENAQLMAIVNTDILNARAEPLEDAKIWTQIANNERFPVVEQLDGWVKIELEEEDEAYVKSEFVDVRYALNEAIHFSPAEEAAMESLSRRQQIVNFALKYLGNRYVWGGTSLTNGIDCSGFTMKVMEQFGVSLPHYSVSQSKMGKKVTKAELRPGDLVFYSNSSGTINHVALYIGNDQVISAASRKLGIRITAWNYRTPRGMRNVLGD